MISSAVISICVLMMVVTMSAAVRKTGECTLICNDLRYDVLTMEMCKEAKKIMPRPKVGDFCSLAMEQGFADVCLPLCTDQQPSYRVSQACRTAAMEMPRPTVRKWCEHGYTVAYEKAMIDLKNHFNTGDTTILSSDNEVKTETSADIPAAHVDLTEEQHTSETKEILMSIAVGIDDKELTLNIYKNENPEESVVSFCKEHVHEDVPACIRQILPVALEKIAEQQQ